MSRWGSFLKWARQNSSPKDLAPLAIGVWLLKTGIDKGNEMFIFISLYLFGLIPAWWADKMPGSGPSKPSGPDQPPTTPPEQPSTPATPPAPTSDPATLEGSESG